VKDMLKLYHEKQSALNCFACGMLSEKKAKQTINTNLESKQVALF